MKLLKYCSICILSVIGIGALCCAAGIRINTSESIPLGIYRICNKPVEKGEFVLFCPPPGAVFDRAKERGYVAGGLCPGGYGYMMKNVVGTAGDIVTVHDDGVHVNGVLLPKSRPFKTDPAGRPLHPFQADSYTLGKSEVLLMSDVCSLSFDGRYFGPIDQSQIKSTIRPVFTW